MSVDLEVRQQKNFVFAGIKSVHFSTAFIEIITHLGHQINIRQFSVLLHRDGIIYQNHFA